MAGNYCQMLADATFDYGTKVEPFVKNLCPNGMCFTLDCQWIRWMFDKPTREDAGAIGWMNALETVGHGFAGDHQKYIQVRCATRRPGRTWPSWRWR